MSANLATLDERLCFALYANSQAIIQNYRPYLKALNMTYPQYLVYLALMEHGELTVKGLGEKLFLDSGTLTPLLKRMEQQQLVMRRRCSEDERRVLLSLSELAKSLEQQVAQMQREVSCTTGLEKSEFQALLRQLHALHDNLLR